MTDKEEMKKELDQMNDREQLEMFMASLMMARIKIENRENGVGVISDKLIPVLQKCITNMSRVDELVTKVSNLSENLAIERMSNKRMKTLFEDLAVVLHGNPSLYPPPLNDLVTRIHKEVGLIK